MIVVYDFFCSYRQNKETFDSFKHKLDNRFDYLGYFFIKIRIMGGILIVSSKKMFTFLIYFLFFFIHHF